MDTPPINPGMKNNRDEELTNLIRKAFAPLENRINELDKEIKAINRKLTPEVINKKSFSIINRSGEKLQTQEISHAKDRIQLHEKKINYLYENVVSSKKFNDYLEQLNTQLESITKAHKENVDKVKLFDDNIQRITSLEEYIKNEVKVHIEYLTNNILTKTEFQENIKKSEDNYRNSEDNIRRYEDNLRKLEDNIKKSEEYYRKSEESSKNTEHYIKKFEDELRQSDENNKYTGQFIRRFEDGLRKSEEESKQNELKINVLETKFNEKLGYLQNHIISVEHSAKVIMGQIESVSKKDNVDSKELNEVNQKLSVLEKSFTEALDSIYKEQNSRLRKIEDGLQLLNSGSLANDSFNEQINNLSQSLSDNKDSFALSINQLKEEIETGKKEFNAKFRIFQSTIPSVDTIGKDINTIKSEKNFKKYL